MTCLSTKQMTILLENLKLLPDVELAVIVGVSQHIYLCQLLHEKYVNAT